MGTTSESVASEGKPAVDNLDTNLELRIALRLRAAWMRAMNIPEDEISENCDPKSNSADLEEEIQNLVALDKIRIRNAALKESKAATIRGE